MNLLDMIGSQAGRVVRVGVGAVLVRNGLRRHDALGRAVAAMGLVPVAAGVGDVCLLGPLAGGPLGGRAFRRYRSGQ